MKPQKGASSSLFRRLASFNYFLTELTSPENALAIKMMDGGEIGRILHLRNTMYAPGAKLSDVSKSPELWHLDLNSCRGHIF